MDNKFKFDISLSILNHLGRNLYRNFATVLGEAISNSWDANSKNVWIDIDYENNRFWIKDDGVGMDATDFQDKFLKIGYSKRKKEGMSSPKPFSRPYIGNKGIGKLALLSCAKRISIISRKSSEEDYVGGIIDNDELDRVITDDVSAQKYSLKTIKRSLFDKEMLKGHTSGTIIYFERMNDGISKTGDFLKKIIALYFRFSLLDDGFNIYLNGELVTLESLQKIASNTQFVWNINDWKNDVYLDKYCVNVKEKIPISMSDSVTGFIASVQKPSHRNIHSTGEKIGVDLFVNGRVRETDILKHIPTSQIPESYLYGQIHFDNLDSDGIDRFTSSREGVLANDLMYKEFLSDLKKIVFKILDQWDELREKYDEDGDPDNIERESKRFKKAKSLYREVAKEYTDDSKGRNDNNNFIKDLTADAAFNTDSYAQCFISENLLRRYIKDNGLILTGCGNVDLEGETCEDRYDSNTGATSLCEYCKGQRGKKILQKQKKDSGMSIKIRENEEEILMYLDYVDLAKIIDDSTLKKEDKSYKPLRNSVMHTSRLTAEAKTKLTSVFDNIVATVKRLLA